MSLLASQSLRITNFQNRALRTCPQTIILPTVSQRSSHNLDTFKAHKQRARLSRLWIPSNDVGDTKDQSSHSKLLRAGYLRQAHSGIFHMLPLGLRVQNKLEALIDKHMSNLGASRVSLSSISSEELWEKSGRLQNAGSELFRFQDRKKAKFLLSPTHEEEITSLVSSSLNSYRSLPVRLYQISRKYRDEPRPRQGLLRSREFVMKDLYTFDYNPEMALDTYHDVRQAYDELFDELKIPYLVAEADSGDIGGDLSHEFHFPTPTGEDNIISCTKCSHVVNEELTETTVPEDIKFDKDVVSPRYWQGITRDRLTLVNVWYVNEVEAKSALTKAAVNIHAVKTIVPTLDASIEDPRSVWESTEGIASIRRVLNLLDYRMLGRVWDRLTPNEKRSGWSDKMDTVLVDVVSRDSASGLRLDLISPQTGDTCRNCGEGILKVQKSIELGHIFHLGTRYSKPMKATVDVPTELLAACDDLAPKSQQTVNLQMGCHGIGVSRIIGAVADTLADEKGLNWPRVMAPYEAVIVPLHGMQDAAIEVYDHLSSTHPPPENFSLDLVLDDRDLRFPAKMKDADLTGYPIIVVVGKKWTENKICEVQCRRVHFKEDVPEKKLLQTVNSLLAQL
ncbi:prolyl-tRNA synthetase-like protein [Calycina marina]|uniref:proline--tRNA ligase n=1 Tax=Calycina marina TaxID=1763456 RepID=A0A9P7Z5B3_9HELO|nr:prolyl-tRNA synthetase-like protein [Calycina marina]